jgi:tetratricopeptide (TPR) repeat protein
MKKILVTVVLGVAVVAAGAQDAAQPAQGQPAASSSQAPVIKDPAEYNAYVGAIGQKDPAAQISGLEAFLTTYPNSVMKPTALAVLMGAYQQTNNMAKAVDTATKLVAADPNNERAIFLLAYFDRMKVQSGNDPNAKQDLADAKKYGQMGLDDLPKFTKPDGMSDADFQKMKDQMTGVFDAALGVAALNEGDYDTARKDLRAALDSSPDSQKDFTLIYALTQAYLAPKTPDSKFTPDPVNAIWFNARASVLATPQFQQQFEKYAKSQYIKYHGGDDGWAEVLATAKANATQPAGFTIKPAPTPAEQAHKMVQDTTPDKMDFATWEFVLSNGAQEDQDAVWNAIKGKPVQMNGTIIGTAPTEFQIAGSSDDIDAKKADITLQFEDKIPVKMIPKDGSSFDFQGEPASYTPNPFMMTMANGKLLKAAAPAAPAKKPPVHHKPASQ